MTDRSMSELSDHLGYWLRLVSNQVATSFARRLADADVTVAEWVVLRVLAARSGVTPSHLSDTLRMTRGAISKLAERLIAKGLVLRTESSVDARMHTLALSARGRRLVPRLAAAADDNDRHVFGVLSAGERETLRRILEKLADLHGIDRVPVD